MGEWGNGGMWPFRFSFRKRSKEGGDRGNRGKLRAFRDRGQHGARSCARSREREKEGDVMGWGLEWGTGTRTGGGA